MSALVTTYRTPAPLLREALTGLLEQTEHDLEVLVVCDGDPGPAQEEELDAASRDPRVRVLRPGRVGRGRALNLAVEAANAPYVAIQDADDASHPRRLEWQLDALDLHPDVAVLGTGALRTRDQTARADWAVPAERPPVRPVGRRLLVANPLVHSSVVARRDAVLAVGGYDASRRWQFDHDLYLRVRREGGGVAVLGVPLVLKRLHVGQVFESGPALPRLWSSYRLQIAALAHEPVAWRPPLAAAATVRLVARCLRSTAARAGQALGARGAARTGRGAERDVEGVRGLR